MKKLLSFIISFTFLSVMAFTGCSEVDRSSELTEFLDLNESSFSETITEDQYDFITFSQYLYTWAEANSLDVVFSGDHSIVLKNEATEGYEDEPGCVLLCSFNTEDAQKSKEVIATGQTALIGPLSHGDITLAVTEYTGTRLTGIEELPEKYITCDNLINLNTGNNNNILTSGPVAAESSFRSTGSSTESAYTNAYVITMSIPEYTDPFDFVKGSSYPNPIGTIGSFLASSKSSGRLFDIASFTSKSHEGYTPYYARAVVVVDTNHAENFESRFEKSYSNIEEKFEDLEAEFEYTMEETDIPDAVLSSDVADNLISLMYTMNTGVCQQDEDSGLIYAASYLKSVKADQDGLDLTAGIRARGESYLDSLSSEYETTAGLCSTKYSFKNSGRLWSSDANSSLVNYFTGCVPQQGQAESAVSLRTYENDLIAKALPDQNMIIYSFEKGDRKTVLENIIGFLDPSVQKQP